MSTIRSLSVFLGFVPVVLLSLLLDLTPSSPPSLSPPTSLPLPAPSLHLVRVDLVPGSRFGHVEGLGDRLGSGSSPRLGLEGTFRPILLDLGDDPAAIPISAKVLKYGGVISVGLGEVSVVIDRRIGCEGSVKSRDVIADRLKGDHA